MFGERARQLKVEPGAVEHRYGFREALQPWVTALDQPTCPQRDSERVPCPERSRSADGVGEQLASPVCPSA